VRVLIVGGTGVIGSCLQKTLAKNGHEVVITSRKSSTSNDSTLLVNLENISDSVQTIRNAGNFDAVVLSAGVSSIRACQVNPQTTSLVNVDAQVEIANDLLSINPLKIVLISSNRVFDGSAELIKSKSTYSPTTEYGRQKSQAETELLSLGSSVKIVRFSKVISEHTALIVDWFSKLSNNEKISAFVDMAISPITVDTAVNVIENVLVAECGPVVQFSAADEISFFDLALVVANYAKSPLSNVIRQLAQDAGDNAVLHSSLESSVFLSIKPMPSLQSVHKIMEKLIRS
jgi:dTDP-4-dehydrorhamnose reductase